MGHEEYFLHSEEFITEKNQEGELVSKKIKIDFEEHPGAINLDANSDLTSRRVDLDQSTRVDESDPDFIGYRNIGDKTVPFYRNTDADDLARSYQPVVDEKKSKSSLLDKTPIEERYFLYRGTVVEKRSKKEGFKRGFIVSNEDVIVKKVLNEETGKHDISCGLGKYTLLTNIDVTYPIKNGPNGTWRFISGDVIWAAVSGEDREKRKEMLKKK